MKILIAPDSFKGCLSAKDVAENLAKGILSASSGDEIEIIPLSDGGEGFTETMLYVSGGKRITIIAEDALKRPIKPGYGILADNNTAVIEMAAASGIEHIACEDKNPYNATTFGTGQLILDALENKCRKIIIGIGGSATNDGGTGMAKALGYRFLDKNNKEVSEGGIYLDQIEKIDTSSVTPSLKKAKIIVACDVTNPLIGENGATAIYGPQKGITPDMILVMDKKMHHLGNVIKKELNKDVLSIEGGGAAGGLGAGLVAFANAVLKSGFDIVKDQTKLENAIANADIVLTGEGKIDFQTAKGKTPWGVAQIAKKYHKPVIGFAGVLGEGYRELYKEGFTSVFSIANRPITLEESIKNAPQLLFELGEKLSRSFSL